MADNVESQKAVAKPASHAKNDFEKDKFILKQLVTKDFKIKYRRSVLGVAWSVLNPLLMMVVMSIVFSTIFGQSRNGSITPEMYPLYLIVGNITFSVMSESTNQALMSIIGRLLCSRRLRFIAGYSRCRRCCSLLSTFPSLWSLWLWLWFGSVLSLPGI